MHSSPLVGLSARPSLLLAALSLVSGCAAIGSAWEYITTERPPYPLRSIELTSDARLDSTGALLGSFVGTGTNSGIALLSSDTGFIAELLRRRRPDLVQGRDTWSTLARYGPIRIDAVENRRAHDRGGAQELRVASPYGHSLAGVEEIILHGSDCGWRGARAELFVSGPRAGSRAPSLRGPILGSIRPSYNDARDWRDPPPQPNAGLVDALVDRTGHDMDSLLAVRLVRSTGALHRPERQHLLLDPSEDIDAAEVLPLWAGQGRVRYAVALRARRITERGDTLLASTVMIWDSAGGWRQSVLAPTVVALSRGQLRPWRDGAALPLYWRRLDAISGFGLDRDYLWVEQIDVDAESVIWAAIEARSNGVVAAAEVGGACSDIDQDRGRGR